MTVPYPTAPAAPAAPLAPPASAADAALGRFVYHDLMTTDPAGARAFYGAVLGWACTPRQIAVPGGAAGATFEYTDVHAAGHLYGGMVPLDPAHGMPSHWTAYVAVDDVGAACARAEAAGGAVCVPPHDIPPRGPGEAAGARGQFAVLNDPAGAMLSVARFADGRAGAPDDVPGGAWWHELLTPDVERSAAFARAVFGWEARVAMTMPDGQPYFIFARAGRDVGGMMRAPAELPRPVWQCYMTVDDVDAAVARALALGGSATWPAMDVPGTGRMAGLLDPTGGMFAVGRAG